MKQAPRLDAWARSRSPRNHGFAGLNRLAGMALRPAGLLKRQKDKRKSDALLPLFSLVASTRFSVGLQQLSGRGVAGESRRGALASLGFGRWRPGCEFDRHSEPLAQQLRK